MAVLQCCVRLLAEMRSSRAAFDLNNCKSGVNLELKSCGFVSFQKTQKCAVCAYFNSEICSVWCHRWMDNTHPTRHTSEFFENWQNRRAYSLKIYDYLSQIQREPDTFLLIVRHNTEWPPFFDWQWRHRTLFSFVGFKNQVNLVLFYKPCMVPCNR